MDIETIPDDGLYTPPDQPPGEEKKFPPIYAHRPVAIGVLWLDPQFQFQRIGIIGEGQDEAGQLAAFSEFMQRESPTLVTWNGRRFDLPVILLRCMRFGIGMGWYFNRRNVRYRYSDEGHLDLGDALSDRGATMQTSLDNAARLVGLPGKMGVDGSQVEGLFKTGQLESIRHYCLTDVIQTGFVLLRYLLLCGSENRAAVKVALQGLWQALEEDGRFAELLGGAKRSFLLLEDL